MKEKSKTQKGITLIALIITIVVLLILAAVAISSIQNEGILGYATNAATAYNNSVTNEQTTLGGYEELLNKYFSTNNNDLIEEDNYDKLVEGTKVKYDSNADGKLEEWIILNNTSEKLEIVSATTMGSLVLGSTDNNITVTTDFDGDKTTGDPGDKAIASYNNAIANINNVCRQLVTASTNDGVRSIGLSSDTSGNYTPTNSDMWFEGIANVKTEDTSYLADYNKMHDLGILKTGTPYWLVSRFINVSASGYFFGVRAIDVNGEINNTVDLFCVTSYGVDVSPNVATGVGVRPIVINPTEIYY